jgi:heat shock transcription factor
MVDPERAYFDEEIERITREKAALEANISRSKQQRSAAKLQFEDLKQRVDNMEQRQDGLLTFLEKALVNPTFAEILARKIDSMDFSAYNKKRRLPQVDQSPTVVENSFVDNHSSSRPDFGNVFHQDFSSKLRLELSPAVSDINLVSHSTQSSNEDGESLQRRLSGEPKGVQMRTGGFVIPPETLDLSDTGTSFTLQIDSTLSRKVPINESPSVHPLQPSLTSNEEGDGHISCHLNLTLASSPLQVNKSPYSARMPQLAEEIGKSPNSMSNANSKESDTIDLPKSKNLADDTTLSSSQRASNNNQVPAAAPARVNDVFWEQFLTERPGCSDNEEASSTYRAAPNDEQDDGRTGLGMSRNAKNMEQLTL